MQPTDNLLQMNEDEFASLVNDAYKAFGNVLGLSRSPLAASTLVEATLVLDHLTPTAVDRGRGLQLVLCWAVEQLAPSPPQYPIGTERPFDDPTWHQPTWWRYNILRHRYVEPLPPDIFVDGGRFTETLVALTGIPSTNMFFDERNRSIRAASEIIRRQLRSGDASAKLAQHALTLAYMPIERNAVARSLLGVAAVLDGVFPRSLLLSLAHVENLPDTLPALEFLIANRLLRTGDDDSSLWISPTLRQYVYQREPADRVQVRHSRAATYYRTELQPLIAVRHLRRAGQWQEAAALLIEHVSRLASDLQLAEIRVEVEAFSAAQLDAQSWRHLQTLRSDIYSGLGDSDTAIKACRVALKSTAVAAEQAPLSRRLGKLYEMRNQMHALSYYQQAEARFLPGDRELITLLKDRGWLHIHRRDWDKAQADLKQALQQNPDEIQRADILDALAALHRYLQHYDDAILTAQEALALREQTGDLLQVAKSLGNLGLLYSATGNQANAIAAHREAYDLAQQLGNRELATTALLNTGLAQHMAGDHQPAIVSYRASLALAQETNARLIELRALANLAEVLVETDDGQSALSCWQAALDIAEQEAFDDEKSYLLDLAARFAFQVPNRTPDGRSGATPTPALAHSSNGDHRAADEDRQVMELVRVEGSITPRRLMEVAHISKATATRRLATLTDAGRLALQGRGRNTHYVLSDPPPGPQRHPPIYEAEIQKIFVQHLPWLAHSYGIRALGWLRTSEAAPSMPTLVVQFARLPTLLTFLELRTRLVKHAGISLDLLPMQAVAPEQSVTWFATEI